MSDNLYKAPESEVRSHSAEHPTRPTLWQSLFSFKGRFPRTLFWAYGIGVSTLLSFLALIPYVILIIFLGRESQTEMREGLVALIGGLVIFCLVLYLPAFWVYLAASAKRYHDLGKSGWWSLLNLVPFGPIWILVECGFFQGQRGPNVYGRDPLQTL